ncbi:MAG: OmpA family protein [Pseudomonadota bacterium]
MRIFKVVCLMILLLLLNSCFSKCPKPCAIEEAEPINVKYVSFEIIRFDLDKYNLTDVEKRKIERNARLLRENDDLNILLMGHTDNRGTDEQNYELGLNRAKQVKEYLKLIGIAEERLNVESKGAKERIHNENISSVHAVNRRVEFIIDLDS